MSSLKTLLFLALTLSFATAFAQGRAPAVEDFVGVETQDYVPTPEGTQVSFNFDQKIGPQGTSFGTFFPVFVLFAFISLPFFMWVGVNRSLKKVASTTEEEQNFSNVEYLKDYQTTAEEMQDIENKRAS